LQTTDVFIYAREMPVDEELYRLVRKGVGETMGAFEIVGIEELEVPGHVSAPS
jgi:hypothetical protein